MDGIIVKGVGGLYTVRVENNYYKCKARGKFRYDKYTPMVGDRVKIMVEKDDNAVIEKIYERTSELIRPFVANVTQAFVVFTLNNPSINIDLLNRFIILCEYNNLNVVLCLNKMDLVKEGEYEDIFNMLRSMPYEVIFLNADKEEGIDTIKEKLKDNISVFCGPSGVGKSTILNAVIGKEHMETGEVSEKLKRGKHTTRHAELVQFENGFLVDTPGFSSINIDFIKKEDLQNYFPELKNLVGECKFSNCMHYKEPGCIVKNFVEEEKIHKYRYEVYIRILEELQNLRRY